ncbi:MAG: CDP-2,3-bis-(O-geranylgeranyl)-sn-glycerol synthase [Candidatus Diapherotrites archaeon]|uniref:CDP-archaeol synthase n=1 Tax=Candidatus Iainarchaeum sp. TaxID=3101447 RepID=A0A8T4C8V2_9ARCH|nr:CDP-2,3-bis-(O-geranylgeranyl)-sn-glycerol synthase [Candidatus Diapherotrites archaeon]
MDPLWIHLFLTALPLYVANSSAMVFGGKTPIDGNRNWSDGRPIFGKGKTWKGTGMGVLIGTFVGLLLWYFFPVYTQLVSSEYVAYVFLLSTGGLVGDIVGSFIKRRMNMPRGHPAQILDQLDFVVGGVLFSVAFSTPNWTALILLVMITPFMHMTFNRLAYMIGMKSVPW